MTLAHSPQIITDGLIALYDAKNIKSYSGSGSQIYNVVDNVPAIISGTYSYSSGSIIIENTSTDRLQNVSRINLPTLNGVKSISLWFKESAINYTSRYLLDSRTGFSNGWIYSSSVGSSWSSGTLYKNGGIAQTITWQNISSAGDWKNITVTTPTAFIDDINLFSRYSNNEGLNVEFGMCLIYNKEISEQENKINFDAIRGRYGI